MKVVFLDFDGVLNSTAYDKVKARQDPSSELEPLSIEWWAEGLDPVAVERLNGLLKRTGAGVVVSSSWRLDTYKGWLQRVLEMRGFKGKVIGTTWRFVGYSRNYEIKRWLELTRQGCAVNRFVVIDDNVGANIPGHFVHTDFSVGLTDRDVEKAVAILGEIV